ncbi:DNA repair protein RadC [Vibrio crassostreae]|nr:DNA repair protein RadC [Vibrio crassostreae]CAK3057952.1 DNA repair protein RadC [Vibrio crassostreae]CAK3073468.1 DNA repair protein RadC [Vibrio crassostreae]CAK3075474.1 DNA repair protein RadC [Vibrio crassostreae]CAK3075784.1 DNA repair protein RadC [Vibrio crassostreae]
MAACESEVFEVIFLDNQHRVLRIKEMFYGTVNAVSVYLREVVKS